MLRSRALFSIQILVHPPQEVTGQRRVLRVAGGAFEGDRLRGRVVPDSGADWLLARADGAFQQDVRLMLETDDGALVLMRYRGVRHASPEVSARLSRGERVPPSEYYLRTAPWFETGEAYGWLNRIVAVGVGERLPDGARYEVYEVL